MSTTDPQSIPGILESVLDGSGRLGDPVRVIRLDGMLDDAWADRIARSDHILVGVLLDEAVDPGWRELAARLDVSYAPRHHADLPEYVVPVTDPQASCRHVITAIRANPYAAHLLGRELRATSGMDIRAALDVESFAYSTLLGGAEFHRWLTTRGPRPMPPDVAQPVRVERTDDVLRIVLNRPERRNAYGAALRDGLCAALDIALADTGITTVHLSGAGPVFCSGGDLDEFGTTPDTAVAHTIRTVAGAGRRIADLADRMSVRVHGACVGAGIEVPAFAGTVIGDPDAHFRLPEVGMGLIPGAGGTVSIARRIGRWRTFHLAVSGETLDAGTALSWGLIDRIEAVAPAEA